MKVSSEHTVEFEVPVPMGVSVSVVKTSGRDKLRILSRSSYAPDQAMNQARALSKNIEKELNEQQT